MGAVTCIMYVDKFINDTNKPDSLYDDQVVVCMLLDSPFTDVKIMIQDTMKAINNIPKWVTATALLAIGGTVKKNTGYDVLELKPIKHVKKSRLPALFMVGKEDIITPPDEVKKIHNKYGADSKEYYLIDGEHHETREDTNIEHGIQFVKSHINISKEKKRIFMQSQISTDRNSVLNMTNATAEFSPTKAGVNKLNQLIESLNVVMPENSDRQFVSVKKPNLGTGKLEESCNQMANTNRQGLSQNKGDLDTDDGSSIKTNPFNQSRFEKLEKCAPKENIRETCNSQISFDGGYEFNNTDRKIYADEFEQLEIPRDENNRNKIETVKIEENTIIEQKLNNDQNSISNTNRTSSNPDQKENMIDKVQNNHNRRVSGVNNPGIIKKTNKIGLVSSNKN